MLGRTSQPSSSDMMELEWDDELSWLAQAHADTCKFGHDCNKCRKLSRWRNVGQNLYQSHRLYNGLYFTSICNSFNSRGQSGPTNWKAAIDAWFWDEIDLFPQSSVYSYKFEHKTGHYSQMVWSKTTRLGCGLTEYKLGNWVAK